MFLSTRHWGASMKSAYSGTNFNSADPNNIIRLYPPANKTKGLPMATDSAKPYKAPDNSNNS